MPLAFVFLAASTTAWFVIVAHLLRLLRTRQPDVYDRLGRPTLILNNNVQNGWLFTRFLLGGHFTDIVDTETLFVCRFLRVFAFAYTALLVFIVVLGFATGAH